MSASVFARRLGMHDPFDPQCLFVTSPIFSPLVLALIRLTLGVYVIVGLCVLLAQEVSTHTGASFPSFFTHLSWIGVCAWLMAGGVQTLFFALNLRPRVRTSADPEKHAGVALGPISYPLQTWPPALRFLHVLLWATITSFPLVTTVIFWSLLASSGTFSSVFSTWSNISAHAMNTVFALFEIFLTNNPAPPWSHLPFLIFLLGCYLGVAYITHATQHFYVYPFLDPVKQRGKLAAYIVGIALACVVLFALSQGFIAVRRRLSRDRTVGVRAPPTRDGVPPTGEKQ